MNNTIVMTGGGTAGHVTPNITLIPELKQHFNKIVYIGSKNGIEKELIKKQTNIPYYEISTVKFIRKNILKNLLILFKLTKAINEVKAILKELQPSIIFSKGGYVGLPVVIAAHKLSIPIICHESDLSMGLANKIAKRYANIVCTNFEITAKQNGKKCVCTGTPLKQINLTKNEAREKLKIKTDKPVLLVTGGSLGAKNINEFIFKNIDEIVKNYYVIHLVGKENLNKNVKANNYEQIEFSSDMWTLFKAADYAISRAGANTIIELISNKILTVFIPLPKGNSRGDQIENAKYIESLGLAKTIYQDELTLKKMQNSLIFLKNNAKNIKNKLNLINYSESTNKIIDLILKTKLS